MLKLIVNEVFFAVIHNTFGSKLTYRHASRGGTANGAYESIAR